MDHKLIFGGEQYLPFARSRLAAIRARGAKYAVERYSLPDASIKVQVIGEDSYIHITGGGGQIAMDAGIIDLVSIAPNSPLRYASGTRGETRSTQVENLPYALQPSGASKWASWLTYPAGVPDGQIVGTVSFQPFTGHLRASGEAPSFTPARKPATPATDPPTWVLNPADDTLFAKKLMVANVPASIFTGRTRLYVQSMYGRPLYDYANATATEPSVQITGVPAMASISPPTLVLPAFKKTGDTTVYLPVTITTGTGVRFDAATGKHWLINVSGGFLNVYPLVSSRTGESLRPILAGKKLLGRKTPMNPDDIAMLEAFVLAYCLPDVKNAFQVQLNEASSSYAMGYSWHWNASGSAADIVLNGTFSQGMVGGQNCTAMESTHRRISVTVDAQGNWGASNTVIEGPTRWAVSRGYWCIAEPLWTANGPVTIKTTPRYSSLFECNAPIYSFYVGDTLNLVRVSVSLTPATAKVRTHSNGFADDAYGGNIGEYTCGMLDGFCDDADTVSAYYVATFSCGSTTYAGLKMPWSSTSLRLDNTKTGYTQGVLGFTNTYLGTHRFTTGYPAGSGGSSGYTYEDIPNCLQEPDSRPIITLTRETYTRNTTGSSTATIIVPLYDAEAVFMEGTQYNSIIKSGTTRQDYSSPYYADQTSRWIDGGQKDSGGQAIWVWQKLYVSYDVSSPAGATLLSTTTPADSTSESDVVLGKNYIGRGGVTAALMDDLASFRDASLDYAAVNYGAFSGYRTLVPAAFSTGRFSPIGIPSVPASSALVGWV